MSVGIIANDIWFNARNLNCWLCQLGVLAKVTVLWNTGKWNYIVVGISHCLNTGLVSRQVLALVTGVLGTTIGYLFIAHFLNAEGA